MMRAPIFGAILMVFVATLIPVVSSVVTSACASPCSAKADVVFIIDSSGSIRAANPADDSYDNWALMLNFVADLVDRMNIGENDTRVGVVVYSLAARSEFYLNSIYDKGILMEAIYHISYDGTWTNTSGGIREMHNVQFTAEHGDRSDVPNIAIIITDGVSNKDAQRTIPDAREAEDDHIELFAIGITDGVDEAELAGISSAPQEKNVTYWTSPDFSSLESIAGTIEHAVCAAAPVDPPCTAKADVVFIIDSSRSIRDANPADGDCDNWALLLNFVADVVNRLMIGENDIRVGVVVYSHRARSEFYLNSIYDKTTMIDKILDIDYDDGYTNTSSGIREMHKVQFTPAHGDRPDVPNIGVVITGGKSNKAAGKTIPYARDAKNDKIKIFGVGVSEGVSETELSRISSAPRKKGETYWTSVTFTSLGSIASVIQNAICGEAPSGGSAAPVGGGTGEVPGGPPGGPAGPSP